MTPSLTLPSTFILTLLLLVGLFFFVKAATKDRTQLLTLIASDPEEVVLNQLDNYLQQRAYRLIRLDRDQSQLTFEGIVRPSVGLALFLMGLVAIGLLCLGLVLTMLWPGGPFIGLVFLSPLSVLFYWQRAQRPEQVQLKVEPQTAAIDNTMAPEQISPPVTRVTVKAHRDELNALKSAFPYRPLLNE